LVLDVASSLKVILQVVNDPNDPSRKFCFSFCHRGEQYDCKVNLLVFLISFFGSSNEVSVSDVPEDK